MKSKFALDEITKEVVFISKDDSLPNGKNCGCICPICYQPVIAKHGGNQKGNKAAHFAHPGNATCSKEAVFETILHKLAKKILAESSYIDLPKYAIKAESDSWRNMSDPRQNAPFVFKESKTQSLLDGTIREDSFLEDFKPDLLFETFTNDGTSHKLAIEIAVTHFVDNEKKAKIRAANISTIEIDLSSIYKQGDDDFDFDLLKQELLTATDNKTWIYNVNENAALEALKKRNRDLQSEIERKSKNKRNNLSRKTSQSAPTSKVSKPLDKRATLDTIAKNTRLLESNIDTCNRVIRDLHDDSSASTVFSSLKDFHKYANSKYGTIPAYCDVSTKKDYVFLCDHRVWQMILFKRFIFRRKSSLIKVEDIYAFFIKDYSHLLNPDYVYTSKRLYDDELTSNNLIGAILHYLSKLKELHFIEDASPSYARQWDCNYGGQYIVFRVLTDEI